jgi:hypothetical protein
MKEMGYEYIIISGTESVSYTSTIMHDLPVWGCGIYRPGFISGGPGGVLYNPPPPTLEIGFPYKLCNVQLAPLGFVFAPPPLKFAAMCLPPGLERNPEINPADCWADHRAPDGTIVADKDRFPE